MLYIAALKIFAYTNTTATDLTYVSGYKQGGRAGGQRCSVTFL